MHIHDSSNWPSVPFGSVRLWDAGVTWPSLEPTKGQWTFTKLDHWVSLSTQNKVDVLMVLGLSPQWASARPSEPSAYKSGNAAEPADIQDWRDFVQTVATRYKGQIHAYEIWNEPSDPQNFSGTPDKMLQLASEAYKILKQVDPSITVVSPAVPGQSGLPWLTNYLSLGGGSYADVIGYHFYVNPGPPENIVPLVGQVRTIMNNAGQSAKPLWNTETGWHSPTNFTTSTESAFVARAYLLGASANLARFYWYAWDDHDWVSLQLTNSDGSVRPSAQSFAQVQTWMAKYGNPTCSSASNGTWTCTLSSSAGSAHVLWNVNGATTFPVPASWNAKTYTDVSGNKVSLDASGSVPLGFAPIEVQ